MKHLHLVVPDLILPKQLAEYACGGLSLPYLEKLLARAASAPLSSGSLEAWLCEQFGLPSMPVAPVTLLADGLQPGERYWLRADPVIFQMQQSQLILQAASGLQAEEAAALCRSLNGHFAEEDFQFEAPHPQRWYLGLPFTPAIDCMPLPQALGEDMRECLPEGAEALRWHGLMNEMQMLLYGHEVNAAREARGEAAVSGVWLWGGGKAVSLANSPFVAVAGSGDMAGAFAKAAGLPLRRSLLQLLADAENGAVLLVWEGLGRAIQGADIAGWRDSLVQLEDQVIRPAWEALMEGELERITLDVLREGDARRFVAQPSAKWKWWRKARKLSHYGGK